MKDKKDNEEQESLKKMIEDLKSNASGLSEDELNSFIQMLEKIEKNTFSKKYRIFSSIYEVIKAFIFFYIADLLLLSLFYSGLNLDNKFMIFLVPIPLAFCFSVLEGFSPPKLFNNMLYDYILAYTIIICGYFLVDYLCLHTFIHSVDVFIYSILAYLVGFLLHFSVFKFFFNLSIILKRKGRKKE